MSTTPRTDALVVMDDYGHEAIHDIDKVREMERELSALKAAQQGMVSVPGNPTIRERKLLEGKTGVEWLEGWAMLAASQRKEG